MTSVWISWKKKKRSECRKVATLIQSPICISNRKRHVNEKRLMAFLILLCGTSHLLSSKLIWKTCKLFQVNPRPRNHWKARQQEEQATCCHLSSMNSWPSRRKKSWRRDPSNRAIPLTWTDSITMKWIDESGRRRSKSDEWTRRRRRPMRDREWGGANAALSRPRANDVIATAVPKATGGAARSDAAQLVGASRTRRTRLPFGPPPTSHLILFGSEFCLLFRFRKEENQSTTAPVDVPTRIIRRDSGELFFWPLFASNLWPLKGRLFGHSCLFWRTIWRTLFGNFADENPPKQNGCVGRVSFRFARFVWRFCWRWRQSLGREKKKWQESGSQQRRNEDQWKQMKQQSKGRSHFAKTKRKPVEITRKRACSLDPNGQEMIKKTMAGRTRLSWSRSFFFFLLNFGDILLEGEWERKKDNTIVDVAVAVCGFFGDFPRQRKRSKQKKLTPPLKKKKKTKTQK